MCYVRGTLTMHATQRWKIIANVSVNEQERSMNSRARRRESFDDEYGVRGEGRIREMIRGR